MLRLRDGRYGWDENREEGREEWRLTLGAMMGRDDSREVPIIVS
jgi:hypothetical protein